MLLALKVMLLVAEVMPLHAEVMLLHAEAMLLLLGRYPLVKISTFLMHPAF